MKKVLILSCRDNRPDYDTALTMTAAMNSTGSDIEYVCADYENLLFRHDGQRLVIVDTVSGCDIAEYDAVFFIAWFKSKILEDVARAVAYYAHAHGVPFANAETLHGRSFTKLSQVVIASLHGVRITPFVFSIDPVILRRAIGEAELGEPYILKATIASRGDDNYLITSSEQLDVIDKVTRPTKYFIAQQYIPNDGDYRVLVMGGEVQRVIYRSANDGSHLNNTSKGGEATFLTPSSLPEEVRRWSTDLARIMRREVTGIDMLMHRETGEYYFLEANNMPQLGTGSFVAEKTAALDEYMHGLIGGTVARYVD